jgi:outer membrane protein assembly factor BamB
MTNASLIIGISGHVVAIDPTTGTELWRSKLKGSDIVTTVLQNGRVYAGTKGELFCIDAQSGSVLWRNDLKGLGFGLVAFGRDEDAQIAERVIAQRRAAALAGE